MRQPELINTFINIGPIHNIHMSSTVSNYKDTHFIQLGEVGVIQLCRNNPDMTEIELKQHSQAAPLSLPE